MKKLRGILGLGMAVLTMLSMAISASAASTYDDSKDGAIVEFDEADFVLVSEEEVALEDEMVADVNFFTEDGIETFSANSSGQQRYRCVAKFRDRIGNYYLTLQVEGTFHWNSSADTATVDGDTAYKGTILSSDITYVSDAFTKGNNQGGLLWGKKYAYVEYAYEFKGNTGLKNTCKLSLNVNVDGEPDYTVSSSKSSVNIGKV